MPSITPEDSEEPEYNPYPDQYSIVDYVPQRYEIKHQIDVDESPRRMRRNRVVRRNPAPRVVYSAVLDQRAREEHNEEHNEQPVVREQVDELANFNSALQHINGMNPDNLEDHESNSEDEMPALDRNFDGNPNPNVDERREEVIQEANYDQADDNQEDEDQEDADQYSNVDEVDQAIYIPPNIHELIRTAVLHILVELGHMPTVPVIRQSRLLPVDEITDEMIERVIVEIANG